MQRGGLDPRQVPITGHEAKCLKIVKDLQALQSANLIANDGGFAAVQGYENIIPHPISLESVTNRVNGKGSRGVQKYTYLNDFATDVRRIFGNFIRFNYLADPLTVKLRKDVLKVLFKFEQLWLELIKGIDVAKPGMYHKLPLPELKWCLIAFEDVVKCQVEPGVHPIDNFIYPIHMYYPLGTPDHKEYCKIVAHPISVADIISRFMEAEYADLDQLRDDLDLLVNNCSKYWSRPGKGDLGPGVIAGAMKLQETFLKSLKASETEWRAKQPVSGPVSLMPQLDSAHAAAAATASAAPVAKAAASKAPVLTLSLGGAKGGKGAKGSLSASTSSGAIAAAVAAPLSVGKGKAASASSAALHQEALSPPPAPVAASAAAGGADQLPPARERAAWEIAAEDVWKALKRHPFVDLTKPTVIADFWRPVAHVDPSIAADYLSVIPHPMDLTTLLNNLYAGEISGPQEFTDWAILVFQNAIDYNINHKDSSYAQHLVPRCEALRRYTYWTALETLPLEDDVDAASSSSSNKRARTPRGSTTNSPLTRAAQAEQRKAREDLLSDCYVHELGNSPYTECAKLLKDLQRGRNKAENIQISYFQVPVNVNLIADYSVYVRNPADLSTIKYRLDGTLPGTAAVAQEIDKSAKRYMKYGEFVAELRRCFANSIKYNGAHLNSDTTGSSRMVYDAAVMMRDKLEALLPSFTLSLCERVERMKIANTENAARMAEQRAKIEKEEAEARKFEQKVLEELKATDHVFAADYDLEQKRKLTELQLKEHILQQQRAMLEATTAATAASMEDLGKDIAPDDTSAGGPAGQMSPLTAAAAGVLLGSGAPVSSNILRGLQIPPYPGFGQSGKVPGRYAHLVQLKKSVHERAWAHWLAAPGTVTQATAARAATSKGTAAARSTSTGGRRDANSSSSGTGSSSTTLRIASQQPQGAQSTSTAAQSAAGQAVTPAGNDSATALSGESSAMDVDSGSGAQEGEAEAGAEDGVVAAKEAPSLRPARLSFRALAPAAKRRRMRLLQGRGHGAGLFGGGDGGGSEDEL